MGGNGAGDGPVQRWIGPSLFSRSFLSETAIPGWQISGAAIEIRDRWSPGYHSTEVHVSKLTNLQVIILSFMIAGDTNSKVLLHSLLNGGEVIDAKGLAREMSTLAGDGLVTGTAKKWEVTEKAREMLVNNAPTISELSSDTAPKIQGDMDLRLGAFVWWDLENSKITPADMRDALSREGMLALAKGDEGIFVADIAPLPAIRQSCVDWSEGRSNGVDKFKAEVVAHDAGSITVGILRRVRRSASEVGWDQIDTLVFDVASASWASPGVSEQSIRFRKDADDARTYLNHRWVRPSVIEPELSGMAAVRLKRSGGFYFIRHAEAERLDRLKRVMAALPGAKIHTVSVGNDAAEAVVGGVRESILDQVVEVQATLQEWREATRKVRSDAASNTMEVLSELLSRATLYESVLQVSMEDLRAEVTACEEEAKKILGL